MYKRTIEGCNLLEISPTPFPAYPDSNVDCRSLEKFKDKNKTNEARSTACEELSKELEYIFIPLVVK